MRKSAWIYIIATVLALTGCSTAEPSQQNPTETDETGGLTAHFIDVDQADATLLEFDGHTILIDAGDWNATDAVDYLNEQGVEKIDIAIGTHPDADHIGQLDKVIEEFDVGEVWMSGNASTSDVFIRVLEAIESSGAGYAEPRRGETYEVGPLTIDILHPAEITGKANDESLSLKVTYGEVSFLFTGDADTGAEEEMIESGADLDADILQLGHHGSNTSSSRAFLKAVSPEIAIYSAGADNSYGHPHAEVLAAAENEGAETYGTDVHGTIRVTTDGKTYEIETEKEGTTKEGANRCLDINRASSAELQELDGIGPALSEAIMDERPFDTLEDLTSVSGIGAGKLEAIKAQGLACIGE